MFSNTLLLYILLASLFVVLVTMIVRLRKFKTWIKTRTKKRPMEEIGYLLYNEMGEASEIHVSGSGRRVPIGRVIIGDGKDDNAYVEVLVSDFEDESSKPIYRSCGYVDPNGYIYRRLSKGKKPEKIGYTAKPSSPNVPTTVGERTWRTLWLGCTLNAYIGKPTTTIDDTDKENDGQSSQKKITGICGYDNNMNALTSEDVNNDSSENTTIPVNVNAPVKESVPEEPTAQEENELTTEEEITEEEKIDADNMSQDSPEETNDSVTAHWNEKEIEELDKIKKLFPVLIHKLVSNMVYVKGGSFVMGSISEQEESIADGEKAVRQPNESPKHNVVLSDYYIGKYPITQAEWKAIMGYNPSECQESNDYPVAPVNWKECQEFVDRLSYLVGTKFSLPTEAQWEFAARGGNRSRGFIYSGSNDFTKVGHHDFRNSVGSKQPNELGIYDMSGLVREWCSDLWGQYSSEDQTDPSGPDLSSPLLLKDPEGNIMRVVRSPAGNETVTNRKGETPELSKEFKSYGFRVVCKEIPKEFIDKKSDNQEKENDENKPAVSPTPTQEGKDEKASKSKPIAICRHYSFHISKGDAMSPEARAAAFAVFYGMYNKKNYTEYYKNKPYGWKDTALLTTFVYSVIYIAWNLIVKFILNERFIGYHFWAVPSVIGLYYPLWAIIRMIKIDRLENSQSIQSRLDLFNKSLSQGSFDKLILTCAAITGAFTLTFYRFDFVPLVWVITFGVSTNMLIKGNRERWRIDTTNKEDNDNPEWLEDEEEELQNPDGDISRSYSWVLDKNYVDPNNLHGNLTLYFTDARIKELRHINPFYAQRKEKHSKEYILDMFHQLKEHPDLTARSRYIAAYINRTTSDIEGIDPLTRIQFTLDFVQEPNITFAINEDCKEIDMFPEYIRWPEETLYDKTGDCNSKALLAAILFYHMGYNTLYMYSRVQQHAAVGIELSPKWEKFENGEERTIGNKPLSELCIKFNGKKYLFCEITMDGFSIGGLLEGMSYEDFEETIELPVYEPEVDDAAKVESTTTQIYYWDLDSEFGNKLHGSYTLEFSESEIAELRDLNPFRTYGIDGRTYDQNIRSIFAYLTSDPDRTAKVREIADYIKEQVNNAKLPELDLVQFALDFAQAPNITYIVDEQSSSIGFAKEYMRLPDEVLFDKEGDCDCKASLTAALFHELGYNVIVMLSEKIGHAAIGVECKENWLNEIKVDNIDTVLREYEGKNYLYCETTGDGYRIGHIKEDSSIQDFDTIVEIKA